MANSSNKLDNKVSTKLKDGEGKRLKFFSSFDESDEHALRQMANHTHQERLENLQVLRRRAYGHLLLPDGTWPPLVKKITIIKASYK